MYKNLELPWIPADLEERYNENLVSQYQVLADNNWINNHFTYKFNSHGFRCGEFSHKPSAMFLGCSFTCGIGLPVERTWSHLVAKSMNLQSVNLGIGGVGPDTAFRLAHHYIPQIQPKLVVFLQPPDGRFSMVSGDGKIYDFLMGSRAHLDTRFSEYYNHWLSLEENIKMHSVKHELAIRSLCQRHNIKFVYAEFTEFTRIDMARDLLHYGSGSNKRFAKLILDRINHCN
jgi:hypothetical protein